MNTDTRGTNSLAVAAPSHEVYTDQAAVAWEQMKTKAMSGQVSPGHNCKLPDRQHVDCFLVEQRRSDGTLFATLFGGILMYSSQAGERDSQVTQNLES